MKALIPLAVGLALAACNSEPVQPDAPENSILEDAAPKAGKVAFKISGMT